jgi:N-methylhydantoinase A
VGWAELPVYAGESLGCGDKLQGPIIVNELTTTVFVGADTEVTIDSAGNYMIEVR